MPLSQPRHDRILASVQAVREEYRAFLAAAPGDIRQRDHVLLVGYWLDDIERSILPRAQTATDDVTQGRWLALGETVVERVRVLLESAQSEADCIRSGMARVSARGRS